MLGIVENLHPLSQVYEYYWILLRMMLLCGIDSHGFAGQNEPESPTGHQEEQSLQGNQGRPGSLGKEQWVEWLSSRLLGPAREDRVPVRMRMLRRFQRCLLAIEPQSTARYTLRLSLALDAQFEISSQLVSSIQILAPIVLPVEMSPSTSSQMDISALVLPDHLR